MKALFDFASRLSVKEPAVHGKLAVYPVFGNGSPKLDYLTLEEALAAGGLKVGEVGGGTVPDILLQQSQCLATTLFEYLRRTFQSHSEYPLPRILDG